ncbi:MAG: hypothetical protein IPM39_09095 [Chloroflexi bacterium]|nr:hypothetical protein [Chloroflexota bacterium]
MENERERAELQRHIQEAEERAAAGGHRLAPGGASANQVFLSAKRPAPAGYATLLVAFAHDCPGLGEV